MRRPSAFGWILLLIAVPAGPAFAHVGKRFFPSTLAIEDPTVSDEPASPSVLHITPPE